MRIDFKSYKQARGFLYSGESMLEALVLVCLVSFDRSLIRHSSVPTHLKGDGPVVRCFMHRVYAKHNAERKKLLELKMLFYYYRSFVDKTEIFESFADKRRPFSEF